ncbi:MAG: peptidylprolyl isomerase [Planctomycetota bacterium]
MSRQVPVGKPVWVDFTLQNLSGTPALLTVPGTQPERAATAMGLPLSHVFSGRAFAGLAIEGSQGRRWDVAVDYQPPGTTEVVEIAPYGSVGIAVDVSRFYPVVRTPGRYRLRWEPYGGALHSNELLLEVAARKQVTLVTDFGEMTIKLCYEEAPKHVDNFLELAQNGFYDNLTFHKLWPGTFIQGGCPLGNGTGIRPDGKKLPAEFNGLPEDRGAVSMARLESDPDSASCQFFICNTRIPEWDGRYTIFSHLVGDTSYETLDKLMAVPVDEQGRPRKRVYIRGVRIEDVRGEDSPTPLLSPADNP